MSKKKNNYEDLKKAMRSLAQSVMDTLGRDDTQLLLVMKKGNLTCSMCTDDSLEIARSLVLGIADEENSLRLNLYEIVKAASVALLLCDQFDVHKDFEDCISEVLFESLQK